jgi:tetratricopeptide (TPR) repeat protein
MDLANSYNAAGVVQRKLGDYTGAQASHRAELALKQRLVARDPPNQTYKLRVAAAHGFLAELELALGRPDDAARHATASRDLYAALAAADTSNPDRRRSLGTAHRIAGTMALERGRTAEALDAVAESRALLDPRLGVTPNNAQWQIALAKTLTFSSRVLTASSRVRAADVDARRAVSILEGVLTKRPADQPARLALTEAYLAAGDAEMRMGDSTAAWQAWTGALATVDSAARATGIAELRVLNATALVNLGRSDEARPIVQTLEQQGYRRPRWVARMRAAGVLARR